MKDQYQKLIRNLLLQLDRHYMEGKMYNFYFVLCKGLGLYRPVAFAVGYLFENKLAIYESRISSVVMSIIYFILLKLYISYFS